MIYHALELRVPLNFEKKAQPQGRGFELGERESLYTRTSHRYGQDI